MVPDTRARLEGAAADLRKALVRAAARLRYERHAAVL